SDSTRNVDRESKFRFMPSRGSSGYGSWTPTSVAWRCCTSREGERCSSSAWRVPSSAPSHRSPHSWRRAAGGSSHQRRCSSSTEPILVTRRRIIRVRDRLARTVWQGRAVPLSARAVNTESLMGHAGRRRRRLEAAQLVGVHDTVESSDVGAIGGEGGDAVDGAVEQVGEEGGVAVDAGKGVAMVGAPLAVDGEEESDDTGTALEDFAGGSDFAAAVGGEGDGFGEEGEQGVGVVAGKGGEEAFEELMLDLGGDGAPRAAVAHAGVRAMDHLAAHGLALAEEGGELGVGDVEELAQEKGGALFGVETLEEGDEREGEVGSALEGVNG